MLLIQFFFGFIQLFSFFLFFRLLFYEISPHQLDLNFQIFDISGLLFLYILSCSRHQNFDSVPWLNTRNYVLKAIRKRENGFIFFLVLFNVDFTVITFFLGLIGYNVRSLILLLYDIQRDNGSVCFNLQLKRLDSYHIKRYCVLINYLHPSKICHMGLILAKIWMKYHFVELYLVKVFNFWPIFIEIVLLFKFLLLYKFHLLGLIKSSRSSKIFSSLSIKQQSVDHSVTLYDITYSKRRDMMVLVWEQLGDYLYIDGFKIIIT